MESMERVILSLDARDIILKQLAFQNVSPTCQSLLRQIRKSGSISDYIKASAEVSPSYLQGVAKATVLQRQTSTQFLTKQDRDKVAWTLDAIYVDKLDMPVNFVPLKEEI